MNLQRTLSLLLTLLLTPAAIHAADPTDSVARPHNITISGELLSRAEWRNGVLPSQYDNAQFIIERTRLNFIYSQPHLAVQITPQHSGVWGAQSNGTLLMFQAWAQLTSKQGLFAKIGRQTLNYDDERIIGINDWSMTGAYHDALKVGYHGRKHLAEAVLAYNQNNSNTNGGTRYENGGQIYKTMQLFWYHFQPRDNLGISALLLNTGLQDPDTTFNKTRYQQLFGTYIDYHPRNVRLQGSFYLQRGRNENNLPIRAWTCAFESTWQPAPQWRLNTGYFHLSGDKNYTVPPHGGIGLQRLTEERAFSLLFGSKHQFYGAMDFFYLRGYYGGRSPGLQDFHVGSNWQPIAKLNE